MNKHEVEAIDHYLKSQVPDPAYPRKVEINGTVLDFPGMDLKDRVAIAALQSILQWESWPKKDNENYEQAAARHAFEYAEAFMEERDRRIESRLELVRHLRRQIEWSERTFGPGPRPEGIVEHIRKELQEILDNPNDLSEWIDVAILAFDGAWRMGYSAEDIAKALANKQARNESRKWPDWRTAEPGQPIEHIREE